MNFAYRAQAICRTTAGSVHIAQILFTDGARASRKPRSLFRLSGVFLLRFADRQFLALLFQPPPRQARFEPEAADHLCL